MTGTILVHTTVVWPTMKNNHFYNAIYQIIKTGHWITDSVSHELKAFGISEPQFNVLRILKGQRAAAISVEEITKHMVQRSSNVTRIIDKLLVRGFVTRKECPTNRRKMDVSITEEGGNFLEVLNKKVGDFHEPMIGRLTDKEAQTLTTLIKKLKE